LQDDRHLPCVSVYENIWSLHRTVSISVALRLLRSNAYTRVVELNWLRLKRKKRLSVVQAKHIANTPYFPSHIQSHDRRTSFTTPLPMHPSDSTYLLFYDQPHHTWTQSTVVQHNLTHLPATLFVRPRIDILADCPHIRMPTPRARV